VHYKDKNIAEVLGMTVDEGAIFFNEEPVISRALEVVREVGLAYLRLGQPATELSGGEAQRIKLATELQRTQHGQTMYILDEPTTGLHPSDVERLLLQLNRLVDAGNTVIMVEHDMDVIAQSDWVIDIGPGAGEEGGKIVAEGRPTDIVKNKKSRTAPYLAKYL
jgi:excinuclease ABC subunit A